MAAAGTVAVLLPGAFYFLRETRAAAGRGLCARHGVPIAVATDCNPGTSPLTSLLLAMNMAATSFGLTVEECLAGVTRNAARALGLAAEIGTLEAGKRCDLAIWDIERPAELVYRIGLQPAARAGLGGTMKSIDAQPGRGQPLASGGRSIAARRSGPRRQRRAADRRWRRRRWSGSSPRGEPVYGVNTGFGKLASVRIGAERPRAAAAQHRAVPRRRRGRADAGSDRAADDGAEARQPGAGRLGRAAGDGGAARGDAGAGPDAGDPRPGSVGASGDLAPLAHMAAAMIGVGEILVGGARVAGGRGALAHAGLTPI